MKKITSFSLLSTLLACCNINAITWEEAIVEAYNNNNAWFNDQIDKDISDESFKQAQMMFLPNISAFISSSKERTDSKNNNLRTEQSPVSMGISLTQNIFSGFATLNTVKASNNVAKAAQHRLMYREQELIVNVLDAYTGIWAGRGKVEALKKKERNLEKTLESQNAAMAAGVGTQSEVALAEANYQKAVYERINAETELFTAESNFEKLTGTKAGDNIELPELSIKLPEKLNDMITIAMSGNHSILYSKYNKESSKNKLSVAKAKLAPSVDVSLKLGKNLSRNTYPDITSAVNKAQENKYSASVEVSIPVFANPQSGNLYSAINIAGKEALKAGFTLKDVIQEVKKECIVNWNAYISANAMIAASRSAVKSAELSSESSMEESVLGLKSNTDVWVKENQLLEARVDFSNARRQRFMAKLRLYALTGKLSLKSILLKQNNGG